MALTSAVYVIVHPHVYWEREKYLLIYSLVNPIVLGDYIDEYIKLINPADETPVPAFLERLPGYECSQQPKWPVR